MEHTMETRPWRTLVHILGVWDLLMLVRLPAWRHETPVAVETVGIPAEILATYKTDVRCHAEVNIGADLAVDLRFSNWEPAMPPLSEETKERYGI